MSIRVFIFCDHCNTHAIRSIEFRRAANRDKRVGRRIIDGRAWFDGDVVEAVKAGWKEIDNARHICPTCQNPEKK
jgi:hypothetical protein